MVNRWFFGHLYQCNSFCGNELRAIDIGDIGSFRIFYMYTHLLSTVEYYLYHLYHLYQRGITICFLIGCGDIGGGYGTYISTYIRKGNV